MARYNLQEEGDYSRKVKVIPMCQAALIAIGFTEIEIGD